MNVRKTVFLLSALSTGALLGAPTVSHVVLSQDDERKVSISYRLLGEPAIVTVDIHVKDAKTGMWMSIGETNQLGFAGDVYKLMQPTAPNMADYVITWDPVSYWPNQKLLKSQGTGVRAVVTAWPTNAPPDYMLVDLRAPFGVTWYPSEVRLPYGPITNKVYKDEYLVMRRMHARGITWKMGTYAEGVYGYNTREKLHPVALSYDYYIGVYQLTAAQKDRGANASGSTTVDSRLPQTSYRLIYMRGSSDGIKWPVYDAAGNFDYASSSKVDDGSWLAGMRSRYAKFGIRFDLPTEAEWEFAARAGDVTGRTWVRDIPFSEGNVADAKIGRYLSNKSMPDCEGLTGNLATVGSYEPNACGLYDMFGNVMEQCLDVAVDFTDLDVSKVRLDPVGGSLPTDGSAYSRRFRGGYYESGWMYSRFGERASAYGDTGDAGIRYGSQGYRLVWVLR